MTRVTSYKLFKMKANCWENAILINFLSPLHWAFRSISTVTTKNESMRACLLSNNPLNKILLRPISTNIWLKTHSRTDQALIAHPRAIFWGIQRRAKFLKISDPRWHKKNSPPKSSFLKLFKIAQTSQSNRPTWAATCQALTRTLPYQLRT